MIKVTAKTINDWRIVPRIIIILYGYVFWLVINWFMGLEEPTNAQAMFVSTVVGASSAFFGLYVNSGKIEKEDTKEKD